MTCEATKRPSVREQSSGHPGGTWGSGRGGGGERVGSGGPEGAAPARGSKKNLLGQGPALGLAGAATAFPLI